MSQESESKNRDINKGVLSDELHNASTSPLGRYRNKVLGGNAGTVRLIQYEIANLFCVNLGGGMGYLLRRLMFASLFEKCGKGLILGKSLMIRKPAQMRIGARVAIDDGTLLDGALENETAISIGDGTVISKGCVIQAKTRSLTMGKNCDIGAHVILSSIGGIHLEDSVLIAGNCYIGGGRYHDEDLEEPIMYQGVYSRGAVTIGEGSWIGASATILDGVTIGKGCVIGANALVTKNIPDYAVAVGSPAKVVQLRGEKTPS